MPGFSFQQKATLPQKPLPIVSIGMGGIVHDAHYPAYQKAGFEVVGGFDTNRERAEALQKKFGVQLLYDSLDAAFANAPEDAVFDLAVPGKVILDILGPMPAGRAVLIQKPMGDDLDTARKILETCREKNLTAAINFQMRTMPHIIAARSMIEQGLIGEVNDIEVRMQIFTPWATWPFVLPLPRLEILYHSIHYIDLVRSFAGTPQSVYAKTLKHPVAPDLAATRSMIIMDYGDGLRANIMTNHGHVYGDHKEQSYIKWEGSRGAIQVRAGLNMNYPEGKPDRFEYILLEDDKPPSSWQTLDIEGSWFPEAFIGSMASLMRFVNGETDTLPTSVEDAFQTMAVIEAAYESSANGGTSIPKA